jgi:redox-sensitive bicupin YhaK (pirin superfamily)
MFWSEDIPRRRFVDAEGRATEVAVVAGALEGASPLAPPPDSWASRADADLAMWTIRLAPHARWTLPAAAGPATRRRLYFFAGSGATLAGEPVPANSAIELRATDAVEIVNGPDAAEFLMLQGRPIGEPVAQYGPFVMNTEAELRQAFADYRATGFGGWPWPDPAPVHGPERVRFARHADGRVETQRPVAGRDAAVDPQEA